jgi:general secretion pathway protein G
MIVPQDYDNPNGFSLVELMIVIAIMVTVSAIAVPSYTEATTTARIVRAIGDIKAIQNDIIAYETSCSALPDSLDYVGFGNRRDPWGNPYEYYKIEGGKKGKGKCRKDKFLVPLNNDYDLYSKGRDGESTSPLTAKISRDDIVRANNGGFIGLASNY